jgi:hypothetical protein
MAKREKKAPSKSATAYAASKKNSSSARVRKSTPKQAKQQAKKEVKAHKPLPGSFKLTGQSVLFIKKLWKPLGGIVLVYALLNLIFGSGFIRNANTELNDNHGKFSSAISSYGAILTGGSSSDQTATMQSVLIIIESLVIIWALRHLFSGEKITVKQAYYHAMAPLVPFLLVLFVIILQLLPLTIGSAILAVVLSTVYGSGAVGIIASFIFVALAAWSLYMVTSSVFALYIVTLPNMLPMQALRSARNLVQFKRWQLMRKLLFLPLLIVVVIGIIIVPLIIFAQFFVVPAFFVLAMISVLFVHTYLYSLYKGLLA